MQLSSTTSRGNKIVWMMGGLATTYGVESSMKPRSLLFPLGSIYRHKNDRNDLTSRCRHHEFTHTQRKDLEFTRETHSRSTVNRTDDKVLLVFFKAKLPWRPLSASTVQNWCKHWSHHCVLASYARWQLVSEITHEENVVCFHTFLKLPKIAKNQKWLPKQLTPLKLRRNKSNR